MGELLKVLLGGVGGGLVVAIANYYFADKLMEKRLKQEGKLMEERLKQEGKLMEERLKQESEKAWSDLNRGDRYRHIMDVVERFEDVRINYELIRRGKSPHPGFEIRDSETIALTIILRDLRVYRTILSDKYYELLMRKFKAAGRLAQAIRGEESNWDAAITEWEEIGGEISNEVEADFHSRPGKRNQVRGLG